MYRQLIFMYSEVHFVGLGMVLIHYVYVVYFEWGAFCGRWYGINRVIKVKG